MTLATGRLDEAARATVALAATVTGPPPPLVRGGLRRAAATLGNLLGAGALVLGIPLAILAIGIPIALGVRFLLWVAGLL